MNHDGKVMDYGHYVSDVFYFSTGIWWHCDNEKNPQIIDLPKSVDYRKTHKHIKKKYFVRINRCIICC